MKKIVIALFMILVLASPAVAKLNVVATLPWIGSLAEELGRDRVRVTVLVKPTQDPHSLEAKPSMILAARNADILMYNGLDLEIGYLPRIIESSTNPAIQPGRPGNLDCSQFITPLGKHETADRSMGDVHPLGDPHYHLSAANILLVARGVAQALSGIDPSQASAYRSSLAAFESRLKEKRKEWAKVNLTAKRFVAYHKLFEYLAREYGFRIVGYVEPKPGIPPSAGHIEELVESMKKPKPDGIITASYYGQREVNALTQKTGVKSIVVPHDVGSAKGVADWFSLMDAILASLK